MNSRIHQKLMAGFCIGVAVFGGVFLLLAGLFILDGGGLAVQAAPIDPPTGYPKLSLSVKMVTPTLANTGGTTLFYDIEIRNTGAYTALGVTLTDFIPAGTTYNNDIGSTVPASITHTNDMLTWIGDVGFDTTAVVTFSVDVSPVFTGVVLNTAVITHPLIAEPLTLTAKTIVVDHPVLTIEKQSLPLKPGANKPLVYKLVVANQGQSAINLPITVTDRVPSQTTLLDIGTGGYANASDTVVTWTRQLNLDLGQQTEFTFSVQIGDVPSGTVISNEYYQVASAVTDIAYGKPYTVTVVAPELELSKFVTPDPPGSNREMTYTLEVFNTGSLATGLVITDLIPFGVSYIRGGNLASGVVSWDLPRLDTGKSAALTYTVYISDVMAIPIVNDDYGVCSAEDVCAPGRVLTSVVQGPVFATTAILDPYIKKPGAGNTPVTPTLIVHNLGPGNALDARATLYYENLSVSDSDKIIVIRSDGSSGVGLGLTTPSEKHCGDDCWFYYWDGDLAYGETITFTLLDGTNTTGGTNYTTTVVITDSLSGRALSGTMMIGVNTLPITGTAVGTVTQQANLLPTKSAPGVIGRGQTFTYTFNIHNSGMTVDSPPPPYLWEALPISGVTVLSDSISHGGKIQEVFSGTPATGIISQTTTVISWTLPKLSTGERLVEPRSFAVQVPDDAVSGTQIINSNYQALWYESETGEFVSRSGPPVVTTIKDVGLIDSYKTVTPVVALPGESTILTYTLHIVNSNSISATAVTVYDHLPWQTTTYQRDAIASAGQVVSDIVSILWTGEVAPFSSELVTFTVLVDDSYKGAITNTAVISNPGLVEEISVQAIAYITDEPVLRISKLASPDPVVIGEPLAYTIRVSNLGQLASGLLVTDTVPVNTTYITDSATAGGQLIGGQVQWTSNFLNPGESRLFKYQVTVDGGSEVVNDQYVVRCAEGVWDEGDPVVTPVIGKGGPSFIYLPVVLRNSI